MSGFPPSAADSRHQPTSGVQPQGPVDPILLQNNPRAALAKNNQVAKPFWVNKLKTEAAKNWDLFYKTHSTNFFKDRHWTDREFSELLETTDEDKVHLEVGCGVGNFVWPLLEKTSRTRFHCCDFSARAIELLRSHPAYAPQRVHGFVHDLTSADTPLVGRLLEASEAFKANGSDAGTLADVISCVFVLSAVPPEKLSLVIQAMADALKPGGALIFRDYALHDSAQLRFHLRPSSSYATVPSLLSDSAALYKRADGTLSYFFTPEEVEAAFASKGLQGRCDIVERTTVNRKEGWEMPRRFVQGRWKKMG